MPRKPNPVPSNEEPELDEFARQVETALEHCADPLWLGLHSPLAAPYFLGEQLTQIAHNDQPVQRGQVLQATMQRFAAELSPEYAELLRVAFFARQAQMDGEDIALALHLSRRSFYRHRTRAILALADLLNQRLRPPLRPESPAPTIVIGRGSALHVGVAMLQTGRSFFIHGASGVGKTTVGAALVRQWLKGADQVADAPSGGATTPGQRASFWYTIRPGLNDQFAGFVFALGYFLRSCGAAHTWRQLVADKGMIQPERIMGLLRYDLASLSPRPLLCLDEVDLLQNESQEHQQILHTVELMRPLAPLLLIGQRVVLETDGALKLSNLDDAELALWLAELGFGHLSVTLRQQLLQKTRGNPAVVTLLLRLLRTGEEPARVLAELPELPSLEAILQRIWRRLSATERTLLLQLTVFRDRAPLDAFAAAQTSIQQLLDYGLLQSDDQGAIQVTPHLHTLLDSRITPEDKITYHLVAMEVRAQRAEVVAAMYHAIQARQPALAVWLWFKQRTTEIERGQGSAARLLLNTIADHDLPDERERTALHISRAELLQNIGRAEEAERELTTLHLSPKTEAYAYSQQLLGNALEMQDRIAQSLEAYRAAFTTLIGTPHLHAVVLQTKMSFLQAYRIGNMAEATREALLARVRAESFHGLIEERVGNFAAAQERYQAALHLAEQANADLATLSRTLSYLGSLTLRLGKIDEAIGYMERAMACDHQRGDTVGPLYDQMNLAYAFLMAGRPQAAFDQARAALTIAEQMKHSYLIAGLASGVGEAALCLHQLDQAEEYAHQSLNQEEEFFRPWALTLLGQIRGAQRQWQNGETCLHQAISSARDLEDRYVEAHAWHKLGDLRHASGQHPAAHAAYQTALQLYTALGLAKEAQEVQAKLATLVNES